MEAIEAVAIIILIIAILILVYYYLLNSPETAQKLRNIVPRTADAHLNEVLGNNSGYDGLTKESSGGSGSGSMSRRARAARGRWRTACPICGSLWTAVPLKYSSMTVMRSLRRGSSLRRRNISSRSREIPSTECGR